MTQPYKAIFFDLFGTLISVTKAAKGRGRYTADILGLDRAAWNQACFGEHHDIVSETNHMETIQRMAHSLDPSIPLSRIHDAAEERQLRFDNALIEIETDILDTLTSLNQGGIKLGLISNASTGEVSAWSRSPLAPLFSTVHFSCEHGTKKPQPGIYQKALGEMAISPEQALFVGDGSSEEHLGAENCGIDSLLVTHFLDTSNQTDMERRGRGSRGTITHISELTAMVSADFG